MYASLMYAIAPTAVVVAYAYILQYSVLELDNDSMSAELAPQQCALLTQMCLLFVCRYKVHHVLHDR